jgi:hypothetical protein
MYRAPTGKSGSLAMLGMTRREEEEQRKRAVPSGEEKATSIANREIGAPGKKRNGNPGGDRIPVGLQLVALGVSRGWGYWRLATKTISCGVSFLASCFSMREVRSWRPLVFPMVHTWERK